MWKKNDVYVTWCWKGGNGGSERNKTIHFASASLDLHVDAIVKYYRYKVIFNSNFLRGFFKLFLFPRLFRILPKEVV